VGGCQGPSYPNRSWHEWPPDPFPKSWRPTGLTFRLIFCFLSNFGRRGNRSGWLGDFVSGPTGSILGPGERLLRGSCACQHHKLIYFYWCPHGAYLLGRLRGRSSALRQRLVSACGWITAGIYLRAATGTVTTSISEIRHGSSFSAESPTAVGFVTAYFGPRCQNRP
jgi:hypothetical protein